jgi:hypothetical protein
MKNNPVLHRIIRGSKPNYLFMGLVSAAAGYAMMAASLINQPYDSLWPFALSPPQCHIVLFLLIGTVIFLAMTTTALYHSQLFPQHSALLRTTLVTGGQVMSGWLLGVLHKRKYWLSATVGAMIFATVISTTRDIFRGRPLLYACFTLGGSIIDIFVFVLLPLSGILVGMLAALRLRQTGAAMTVSGVAALMLMVSVQTIIYGAQWRIANVWPIKLFSFWEQYYSTYMQVESLSIKSVSIFFRATFTTALIVLNAALFFAVRKQLRQLFTATPSSEVAPGARYRAVGGTRARRP